MEIETSDEEKQQQEEEDSDVSISIFSSCFHHRLKTYYLFTKQKEIDQEQN